MHFFQERWRIECKWNRTIVYACALHKIWHIVVILGGLFIKNIFEFLAQLYVSETSSEMFDVPGFFEWFLISIAVNAANNLYSVFL